MLPRWKARVLLPAVALGLALAGAAAAQGRLPLEERLGQAWRWRSLSEPGRAPTFRCVRPWPGGGLIALDEGGLVVFDGYKWERKPGWDTLTWSGLRDVVGTDRGVVAISDGMIASIDAGGSQRLLWQVANPGQTTNPCRLPDGTPVVGSDHAIRRVTVDGLEALFAAPAGSRQLTGLGVDDAGDLLCTTDLGVFRRDGEQWIEVPASPRPTTRSDGLTFALPWPGGLIFVPSYIDDRSMGYVWDGRSLEPFGSAERSYAVYDAAATSRGELILAVRDPELAVWRDGGWHTVLPPPPSDTVVSLCMLSDGRLAVVFASGRLTVCDLESRRWEIHDSRAAGAGSRVNAMAPSVRGGVWLATDRGLVRWDGSRFADLWTTAGDTGVSLAHLTAACEDERGRLWVGTGSGFAGAMCLDGGTWSAHDDPDVFGTFHVHAVRKVNGDLWFTLLGDSLDTFPEGGIVRLDGDQFTLLGTDADGRRLRRSYDVCADADGEVVAAIWDDVFTLREDRWVPMQAPMSGRERCPCVYRARDGKLWVGRGGRVPGVLVRRDRQWVSFDRGDWRRAAAGSFCETCDGRLWMASDFGVFAVTDDDCHEITPDFLPARSFWRMIDDGVCGLWLGGLGSGLIHFQPDDLDKPTTMDLEVAHKDSGEVVVSWRGADFWNDTPPEKLGYRVTVDGRIQHPPDDPLATILRSPRITLTDLEPGEHRMRVQAVDSLGNLEPPGAEFPVVVSATGWSTLPVLAVMVTLSGALLWLVMVLLHRRRERAESQLRQAELAARLSALTLRLLSSQETERQTLSRELHDDLGQILTALCVNIQSAQSLVDPVRRHAALDRALEAARTTLDRTHRISSLLRPPVLDDHGLHQALQTAIRDFGRHGGVDIQADIRLEGQEVNEPVAGHVYRILQEALTNVTRHARAGIVDVSVGTGAGQIRLRIRDDGVGFRPDSLPIERRFGLLGMRERAELLGGTFRVESAPGAGTVIHVSIPLVPRPEEAGRP